MAALLLVAAAIQSTLAQTAPMCAPFDAYDQLAGFEGFCHERVETSGWNKDQPEFDGRLFQIRDSGRGSHVGHCNKAMEINLIESPASYGFNESTIIDWLSHPLLDSFRATVGATYSTYSTYSSTAGSLSNVRRIVYYQFRPVRPSQFPVRSAH